MADYLPEVKRILRANGCYFHRQGKGDHEIWYSPTTNRYFPVDNKIPATPQMAFLNRQAYRKSFNFLPG
jgi:HicA toxin of bacterial toxin-antitoxin,